jgi:bla regulator protein blaR1
MRVILLDNLLRTISWTFIHSLWQGLILTIVAGLVILITKKSVASLRYTILCGLFFLFLGGVVLTFFIEWNAGTGTSSGLTLIANSAGIDAVFHHSVFQQSVEQLSLFLDSYSSWIVLAWLIILSIKIARMVLDMIYINRLRSHNIITPGNEWKIKLQSLSYEIGIRQKVTLVESALVRIPIVLGHFKPVILVPIGILAGLPAAEVEAVLLHELAHIRRHDYLVNFIQRIAELLFFFNPGLLWVSSLLRIERENCCDDIAIGRTKDKVQFVRALISFKEHSLKSPKHALGLFGKRNLLLQRVSRIVYNRNKALSPFETVFFAMNLIIFMLLVSVASKPETQEQAAPLPLASYVEPLPSFSSEPVREILPVTKKKPLSIIKQVTPSFSDNISSRISADIQKPVYPEQKDYAVYLDHVEKSREQVQFAYKQNQLDKEQADKDREQAEKDRIQAEQDRKQADKDREQAEKDRIQAEKDRIQANKDREQAEAERKRADKDREQLEKKRYKPIIYQQVS